MKGKVRTTTCCGFRERMIYIYKSAELEMFRREIKGYDRARQEFWLL